MNSRQSRRESSSRRKKETKLIRNGFGWYLQTHTYTHMRTYVRTYVIKIHKCNAYLHVNVYITARVNDFVFGCSLRFSLKNESSIAYIKYTTCEKWFYLSIKWMFEYTVVLTCSFFFYFFCCDCTYQLTNYTSIIHFAYSTSLPM